MSRIFNNQKNQRRMLFQQVDNSSLDQMNYILWNNSTFDPNYSIRSLFNKDFAADEVVINSVYAKRSRPTLIPSTMSINNNYGSDDSGDEKDSKSNTIISMHGDSNVGQLDNNSKYQMCTLYIDMTYDDRVFFGVHNLSPLQYSLSERQCNVDFSAPNHKVSIMGSAVNVEQVSRSFLDNSILALQFKFQVYCEENFREFINGSFKQFQQQNELVWKVFVTYRSDQPNMMIFNFLTHKKIVLSCAPLIRNLQMQLRFYQLGRVIPDIMSTLQIPLMRRDSKGINSAYIATIENETETQIRTIRCTEFHQYPYENVIITGPNIFQVVQAHMFLTDRFEYELKFQVPTNDTDLLVRTISDLQYDKSAIDITISPSASNSLLMKIIRIKSVKKNFGMIFSLRHELLHLINGRLFLKNHQ